MKKQKTNLLFTILISIVFLSACSTTPSLNPSPTQDTLFTPTVLGEPTPGLAYPLPNTYPQPGTYPVPSTTDPAVDQYSGPLPTSSAGGTIKGILLVGNPPSPIAIVPMYLGTVLSHSEGKPGMVSLDKGSDPRAYMNSKGEFVFINIQDGLYAIILDFVTHTIVLNNPKTGEDMLIEVKQGETVEMGELIYVDVNPIP